MPKDAHVVQFTLAEAARTLAEKAGITEGIWRIGFSLSLGTANIRKGAADAEAFPTGLLSIMDIRLVPAEKEDNISVDMSKEAGCRPN